jgi:N6-adenosine-specific RNA methylase IME4
MINPLPDKKYNIIYADPPWSPKIELFARQKTLGWDTWGNEL